MTDPYTLLATRRSSSIPMLNPPAPKGAELEAILTVAVRVPDHGKLAPWRFIVYRGSAAEQIDAALVALVEQREDGPMSETRRAIEATRFSRSPLVIGVVSTAREHVKIPIWEQVLSAGAAAMNLVNAVHAKGYAAKWVTEWVAYDEQAKKILGIAPEEKVVGFIHVGTPGQKPLERPRPALADVVTEAGAQETR